VPVWEYKVIFFSRNPIPSIVLAVKNVGGSVPGYTGVSREMVWLKSMMLIIVPLIECAVRNLKTNTAKGTPTFPVHPNAHLGNRGLYIYLFISENHVLWTWILC